MDWLRARLAERPWWMNVLMVFCAYMAFVYEPWDVLTKPLARDHEVWFGFVFRGWAAKVTGLLHWLVYGAGAYGFWRMRAWMWPWAAAYAAQVAFSMFVWGVVYKGGAAGWAGALVSGGFFAGVTLALWGAQGLFGRGRQTLRERYGEWALITGASAGIGAEFARALAREGLNCVLSARREDRLRALASELETQHAVATRTVTADLADEGGVALLVSAVADLPIAVVINNAGFGYAGRFDKQDPRRLREMIQVNCVAPVLLASHLVPPMLARGCGAMIVTGSVAGHVPLPRHALYSATKAFDLHFGEALWAECRGTGVDVLVLEPGRTESEFRDVAGEVREVGEPAHTVVRQALEALGRQPSVVSGWLNWLQANVTRVLPRTIALLIAERVVLRQTPPDMR